MGWLKRRKKGSRNEDEGDKKEGQYQQRQQQPHLTRPASFRLMRRSSSNRSSRGGDGGSRSKSWRANLMKMTNRRSEKDMKTTEFSLALGHHPSESKIIECHEDLNEVVEDNRTALDVVSAAFLIQGTIRGYDDGECDYSHKHDINPADKVVNDTEDTAVVRLLVLLKAAVKFSCVLVRVKARIKAAGQIQRHWRGESCRQEYMKTRNAVVLIQACARKFAATERFKIQLRAVGIIRRSWRTATARRAEKISKYDAARHVQRHLRGALARRRYDTFRRTVVSIQSWARKQTAIKRTQAQLAAVRIIQRNWRATMAERQAQKSTSLYPLILFKALVKFGSLCVRAGDKAGVAGGTDIAAATNLQRHWRGSMTRERHDNICRSAVKLQSFARLVRCQRMYRAEIDAARRIQRGWRTAETSRRRASEVSRLLLLLKAAAKFACVLVRVLKATRNNSAAAQIQCCWRVAVTRKECAGIRNKIVLIQSLGRRFNVRNKIKAQITATPIQTWEREATSGEDQCPDKLKGIVIIQALSRRFNVPNKIKAQITATPLQTCERATPLGEDQCPDKLKAIVMIQALARRHRVIKQCQDETRSACRIQNVWRATLRRRRRYLSYQVSRLLTLVWAMSKFAGLSKRATLKVESSVHLQCCWRRVQAQREVATRLRGRENFKEDNSTEEIAPSSERDAAAICQPQEEDFAESSDVVPKGVFLDETETSMDTSMDFSVTDASVHGEETVVVANKEEAVVAAARPPSKGLIAVYAMILVLGTSIICLLLWGEISVCPPFRFSSGLTRSIEKEQHGGGGGGNMSSSPQDENTISSTTTKEIAIVRPEDDPCTVPGTAASSRGVKGEDRTFRAPWKLQESSLFHHYN